MRKVTISDNLGNSIDSTEPYIENTNEEYDNFQGTKGDWSLMEGGFTKKHNNPNLITVYATNDDLEIICKVYNDRYLVNGREQNFKANAQLIANAPKLLETLQKLVCVFDNFEPPTKEQLTNYSSEIKSIITKTTEL